MYNLINGDCVKELQNISDESIDLIVTDPPYKVITGGKNNGRNSKRPVGILSNNNGYFNSVPDPKQYMSELFRVLKNETHCYIFSNAICLSEMLTEAQLAGFKLHNILIWEKNNCTPSQWYMKNCEYVLFLRKGDAKYINNIGQSKTVHQFSNIIGNKVHPTEKPVDLLKFYITNSSNVGDVVLDPFMGSGSTGVACIHTGRDFIGIEIDEKYFNIAKERIDKSTES